MNWNQFIKTINRYCDENFEDGSFTRDPFYRMHGRLYFKAGDLPVIFDKALYESDARICDQAKQVLADFLINEPSPELDSSLQTAIAALATLNEVAESEDYRVQHHNRKKIAEGAPLMSLVRITSKEKENEQDDNSQRREAPERNEDADHIDGAVDQPEEGDDSAAV